MQNLKLIDKNDKIFIAGHKGMVGNAIYKKLTNDGYKNLIVVSKNELDLRDDLAVKKWFILNKPAIVVIAAAKVGGIYANSQYPVDFLFDNLKIQNNLISNSFLSQVKKLLFLGSSCIYPKYATQPIVEEELLNGPLEKTNEPYALAKICGIKLCESLRKQYDFDAISLMPTNLYGPGDNYHPNNSHVLPAFIKKFSEASITNDKTVICWGSGKPMREFLHVDDLANACIFALENWSPSYNEAPCDINGEKLNYLNVGSGKDISIRELANKIAKACDFKGKIIWDKSKPDGTPKKLLDSSRINQLGWSAEIELEKGIQSTLDNFKKIYNNNLEF